MRDIRAAMPRAVIFGQIPPMLLRNGSEEEIIAAVRSDIDKVGADGGLVIATAGSVSEGTSFGISRRCSTRWTSTDATSRRLR